MQTVQPRSAGRPSGREPQPVARPAPAERGLDQDWPLSLRLLVWLVTCLAVAGGAAVHPLVGAGVALAVVLGLVLLDRPVLAALLAVSLAPAVSGLARGLVVPGVRLSELLIIAAAALVLVVTRLDEPPWRAVDWLLLAFATATVLLGSAGALRHGIPLDPKALSELVQPFQFILLLRLATTALVRPEDRARALRWALWTGTAVSALAIGQRFVPPVQSLVVSLTGSDNYAYNELYFVSRATGPFPIWHFLGGYLLVVALLALALLMHGDRSVLSRRSLLVALVVSTTGIILTLTLAVMFGLALGYVVLALWSGRGRVWLARGAAAGTAVAILASPLIGGRLEDQLNATSTNDTWVPQTISFRWDVWTEQYFPALSSQWIIGYGPGIPPEISWRYTESVYITYLLQGGLILLLLFLALNMVLLRTMRELSTTADTTRTAVASTVAAMVVVLVPLHGVFPYMTGLGLPQIFWALAGVAMAGTSTPAPAAGRPGGRSEPNREAAPPVAGRERLQ